MTSTSGRLERISAISSRAACSSSTITLRNFPLTVLLDRILGDARREAQHHTESLLRGVDDHLLIRSVELLEALARVTQPYVFDELPVTESRAVVDYFQLHGIGSSCRFDADDERAVPVAHAVMDRVLHQRLEQHPRDADSRRRWFDFFLDNESRAEASGLDLEIHRERRQLPRERNLVGCRVAQGVSQQIA